MECNHYSGEMIQTCNAKNQFMFCVAASWESSPWMRPCCFLYVRTRTQLPTLALSLRGPNPMILLLREDSLSHFDSSEYQGIKTKEWLRYKLAPTKLHRREMTGKQHISENIEPRQKKVLVKSITQHLNKTIKI